MKKTILIILCAVLLLSPFLSKPAEAATASGKTLTEIYRLSTKYQHARAGGVALAGSSTLTKWATAGEDFAEYGVFDSDTVYNFGISGATFQDLLDQRYINAIVSRKPRVVIIYGANSLTKSRKKAFLNRSISNQATNATIKFIEKVRVSLLKKGVRNPKFLFVSTIKTPYHYKICKSKSVSCNIWDRIDLFNKRIKKYASAAPYCDYINIEPYYYYTRTTAKGKRQILYYLDDDDLRNQSNAANAKALIARKKSSPLFTSDLNHPSKQAYELIWKKIAKQASML